MSRLTLVNAYAFTANQYAGVTFDGTVGTWASGNKLSCEVGFSSYRIYYTDTST